jgi:hypothetical protein
MARSFAEMLGRPDIGKDVVTQQGGAAANQFPLGTQAGAPPWAQLRQYQIGPTVPTRIVEADKQSRVVVLLAPITRWSIYVGNAGVKITDLWIPNGLPYEILIPGNQELYAITDAPVYLTLRVQTGPILVGGERIF